MNNTPILNADDFANSQRNIQNISSEIRELLKEQTKLGIETREYSNTVNSLNKDLAKQVSNISKEQNAYYEGLSKTKDVKKQINKLSEIQDGLERQLIIAQGTQNTNLEAYLELQLEELNILKEQSNELLIANKAIDNRLGLTGKVVNVFSKMPVLKDTLDFGESLQKMRQLSAEGAGFGKILKGGIGELFKGAGSILGKLGWVGILIKGIEFVIKTMFKADEQTTALARTFSMTKDNAGELKKEISLLSNNLNSLYNTTDSAIEALGQINNLTSAQALASKDAIETQINLTKSYKLGADEASKLNMILMMNNTAGQHNLDNLRNQTKEFYKQTGVALNPTKILQKMAAVSGQILSTFKGNTKELHKAVMEAEILGINLEKARAMSNSLLDFESSIESELEAELLTNKEMNLERARALSLQGKFVDASKEIMKYVGGYDEFSKMNVVQQEAVAKAAGLSVDELAESLRYNKYITKELEKQLLSHSAQGQEIYKNALYSGKSGIEAEAAATAQEKFNASLEKAQAIFSDLVQGGTLDKLADIMKKLSDSLSKGVIGRILGTYEDVGDFASTTTRNTKINDELIRAERDREIQKITSTADARPFIHLNDQYYKDKIDSINKKYEERDKNNERMRKLDVEAISKSISEALKMHRSYVYIDGQRADNINAMNSYRLN